jgi:hypothetical protein
MPFHPSLNSTVTIPLHKRTLKNQRYNAEKALSNIVRGKTMKNRSSTIPIILGVSLVGVAIAVAIAAKPSAS